LCDPMSSLKLFCGQKKTTMIECFQRWWRLCPSHGGGGLQSGGVRNIAGRWESRSFQSSSCSQFGMWSHHWNCQITPSTNHPFHRKVGIIHRSNLIPSPEIPTTSQLSRRHFEERILPKTDNTSPPLYFEGSFQENNDGCSTTSPQQENGEGNGNVVDQRTRMTNRISRKAPHQELKISSMLVCETQ
jgi:hypothetical protein